MSKTLCFKAKSVADAAYERITVGVYDVSKANGQITEEGRLGEKRVYVLLPGNDGNLPKVTFPSVSPEIIYSSGTRHLYAAVTNSAMLDDAANWNIFAESDAHGKKIAIPHGNISIKDGVMDIPALTVINKMGLSAEWYPGLDLRANIVVNLFEGVICGDYYIRAVYSREDVVNGAAVSKTEIHVENKNTPDAATILSAAPAGNLMFALKLGDAPVTGYKVTVYNEDMTLTELSDMDFKKKDGNLITVGGSYSAAAEDGSEVTAGLSGGRSYYIGVTPYNEADGSAVYGKEALSEKLFLPEMTTPTVDITADKEKKTRTEEVITESGRSLSETLVFTENDVTFTAAISEKASGTWRLDSGGETEFINSDSVKIALSEITEGKYSLTVKGKDLEGDGFIATYVFTVDTLSPRLLAKSPVNGAMYKDSAIEFSGVTDSDAIISGNTLSFDMPRENVTVKATFSPITGGNTGGTGSGAGTGGGENKKASLRASAGEKVGVKLQAGVSASDYLPYYSDVDLNKTFVPVSAVIDGYVVFIAPVSATYYFGQNRKTFVDISGHWGESYIDFVAERDILKGVGENLFDPDGTMTRTITRRARKTRR